MFCAQLAGCDLLPRESKLCAASHQALGLWSLGSGARNLDTCRVIQHAFAVIRAGQASVFYTIANFDSGLASCDSCAHLVHIGVSD